MNKTIINILIFSSIFFQISCIKKNKEFNESEYILKGDTIYIPPQSILQEKLVKEKVTLSEFKFDLSTAGTVKAIPYLYAEIAPPFSGRITKVYLKLGMKTQHGTPLFEMISPEFTDAQKIYFQAKSELESATLTLKRQKDLKANGVGSDRDLEEAETNYQVKEKEYQNAAAALKIFGVDLDKLTLGQPLIITSPIAGEVIFSEIVNGHYIKADDPPHAIVADLSKVWIAGMVKEKDIQYIHETDLVEVTVAAYPGRKITGKVFHVHELVDEDTRSVQVLIECDNADRSLKPGMYVTVRFIQNQENTLLIPIQAIFQSNEQSFVFVEVSPNHFVRRIVETGNNKEGKIEIVSGLKPGEIIIHQGGFYLLDAK
ncbi:MAG: efflux RND transporter periplasmic adaptor subunit [Flavobacteriales bacterium]|nr:efflux RND transporter periplasmic adaptor subunit [Flavobacteriales bacterium]